MTQKMIPIMLVVMTNIMMTIKKPTIETKKIFLITMTKKISLITMTKKMFPITMTKKTHLLLMNQNHIDMTADRTKKTK